MKPRRDWPFFLGLALLGGLYAGLILAMLVADLASTSPEHLLAALRVPEIRAALWLSLISSSAASILAIWVAVPLGYLLARTSFPGKRLLETLLEVPVVLPPLVVGLSLLILCQFKQPRPELFKIFLYSAWTHLLCGFDSDNRIFTPGKLNQLRHVFSLLDPSEIIRSIVKLRLRQLALALLLLHQKSC